MRRGSVAQFPGPTGPDGSGTGDPKGQACLTPTGGGGGLQGGGGRSTGNRWRPITRC